MQFVVRPVPAVPDDAFVPAFARQPSDVELGAEFVPTLTQLSLAAAPTE
jgi:hypothetical protein